MGTRPHPRQATAAAAGWDWAWEARTGPRQTQTCSDTPATPRLRRGRPMTTLQPTKQQPATVGAVERGGRVTTARQTTTRTVPGCSPPSTYTHWRCTEAAHNELQQRVEVRDVLFKAFMDQHNICTAPTGKTKDGDEQLDFPH